MAETRRWDGDETGRGVAGAGHLAGPLEALLAAMAEPDWVAEDPEAHLLPHIRSGLSDGVRITGTEVADVGELVVTLEVEDGAGVDVRSLAYGLFGRFAESSTFVEERPVDGGTEFVMVTGMVEGQSRFLPHGHTVRLVLRPSDTLSTDGS